MKRLINSALKRMGYEISKTHNRYPDIENDFFQVYYKCDKHTMTSVERLYALYKACKYVSANNIEGDFVECGVWRGGSSMMAAYSLMQSKESHRNFFLYDTYEGMSEPGKFDVSIKGEKVYEDWDKYKGTDTTIFANAALEIVRVNMENTGYPIEKIKFIKGKVEDTIPNVLPEKISILRLDTDWYESTKHELEHLWDLVTPNGVVIIDDYGHWAGSRNEKWT